MSVNHTPAPPESSGHVSKLRTSQRYSSSVKAMRLIRITDMRL